LRQAKKAEKQGIQTMPKQVNYSTSTRLQVKRLLDGSYGDLTYIYSEVSKALFNCGTLDSSYNHF